MKGAVVVLTDTLLRRVVLPIVLLAAIIFRYNLFSFIYLLVLLVSTLLPGPTLKSQKVVYLILLVLLLVFSALVAVGQALFQISLVTNYTLTACEGAEPIWRQCGFVQFNNIPAVDVVRHLLPDVVVFLTALVTLCVSVWLVTLHKRKEEQEEGEEGGRGEGGRGGRSESVPDGAEQQQMENGGEIEGDTTQVNDELADLSGAGRALPFPSHIQCYWKTPKVLGYFMDLVIFIFLGLSGIAIPSLVSLVYYGVFLFLLSVWSVHLGLRPLVRGLRVLVMLYSSLHLLLLHLYQFQSAQDNIPILPNNTISSLLGRLCGLTPIIWTDCGRPTTLLLWPNIPYTVILNPIFVLILFWLLATDLRMWLFTPRYLWSQLGVYCLPVLDQHPSSSVVCITRTGRHREQTVWTQYGTYTIQGNRALESESSTSPSDTDTSLEASPKNTGRTRGRKTVWKKTRDGIVKFAMYTWAVFMSVNYAIAIVAMMAWSVLYPSWLALVLLLWACVIWLIPRVTPNKSLYYTSPLLVLYALGLLLLQYVNSLNLTTSELPRFQALGTECTEENSVLGCESIVLLIKTLLAVVFFAAFHEFVRAVKQRWQERHQQRHIPDGEVPLTDVHAQEDPTSEDPNSEDSPTTDQTHNAQLVRSHFYTSLKLLLSTYWVLVVVGAFLLVILTGQPSLLKTVYLIFFFVFLIIYQIFRRVWYYLTVPMWWLLVVYAVLDLILIYTYQFDVISDAWDRAYQQTSLNISSEDLFSSIGLFKFETNPLRSLIVSLVPLAVFIAVMALQLRYFRPDTRVTPQYAAESDALTLSSLLPKFVQKAVQQTEAAKNETDEQQEEEQQEEDEDLVHVSEEDAGHLEHSLGRQRTASTLSTTTQPNSKLYRCYQITIYLFVKTKEIIVALVYLTWRLLELHMHKVATLVLFAVALSEISAGYWILLLLLLITIPLPYLNPLMYPVVTLYLGLLTTMKMIYQVPIVQQKFFDFNSSDCRNASNFAANATQSDADWLGFAKADNFAAYVYAPIVSGLLLSLWFSARRYQAYHYHSEGITVEAWEKGALFLKVTRWKADRSIVAAVKFLINHFFEMYGVEVSWGMLAIAVAVRIDVYGVFYALALGLLLFTPRKILAPVWLCYLILHGILLLLQYSFLLGLPPGVCLGTEGNADYPWSSLAPPTLKKWLFLPSIHQQILDKSLLYADFLVYLLVCLQMRYFYYSPLSDARDQETDEVLPNMYRFQFLLDYVKVIVFRYSFWLSLFLLFFTAASRVSLFGVIYLLLCFVFLYRGEEMLKDRQHNRHRSWALLRAATWTVLLIRVTLQIVDCVFPSNDAGQQCLLTLLFNGGCNRADYYGSQQAECSSGPESVGLWVDAFNFAVITLQIILFDTRYSEMVRTKLKEGEENAGYFADVFDEKMEERQVEVRRKRDRELQELKDRADALSETANRVDHVLYAGVIIPSDIQLRKPRKTAELKDEKTADVEFSETVSVASDQPKSKDEPDADSVTSESGDERSKLTKVWKFVYSATLEFVDTFIEWLEGTSKLYREVVGVLHSHDESEEQSLEYIREDGSSDITKQKAAVDVHQDTSDEQSLSSYKAAVVKGDVLAEKETKDKAKLEIVAATPDAQLEATPKKRPKVPKQQGDVLIQELVPSEKERKQTKEFEAELGQKAKEYSARPKRFLVALLYAFLAHSEYIAYFLIILNVILNGSIISLVYVFLLFLWGLLSIPWPSKLFWLTMIFYTMFALSVKYAFQFYDIPYWRNTFSPLSGLYPPRLIGILYRRNFFANAVWDMLLLIALLFHRGLLKQSGLWRDTKGVKISNILKKIWYNVKRFFSRLLNPDISLGARDYYVPMLFFDILCFLTIVFGVASFGVGIRSNNVAAVAQLVQTNNVPLPFVLMLLLQFLSTVVDRAIYLRRSLVGRFVFHILLLIIWHVWLFFLLPADFLTARPFTSNAAAQCIYFFKCCYFILSALQIVAGYPNRILGYFLGSKYTTVSGLAFQVYRVIPILSELREVMDWMFTDTVLNLLHWFRVQEIYAQVYLVKVRREREEGSPRYLGEPQSRVIKFLMGAVMLIALVLLIWGPLLVISLINTTNEPNPPVAVNIKLTLAGYQPLVEMSVQQESIYPLTQEQYENLTNAFSGTPAFPLFGQQFQRQDFRQVLFPGESTSLWTISPPARELLKDQLLTIIQNSNSSIRLQFAWSITRSPSSGLAAETVYGETEHSLTNATNYNTLTGLFDSLNSSSANINVSLPNLYPTFIDSPANGASNNFTTLSQHAANPNVSCVARLNMLSGTDGEEWWRLIQNNSHVLPGNGSRNDFSDLEMIIYSDRIAPPVFSAIAGFGIIGLYISVVLVIGSFIRNYISQLPSRLLVDEIVNPDPLLQLCSDIFLVRENRHFRLEEILVGKLFFIFRSPERIIKLTEHTKPKQD